ncbi:sodium:solute symporter family protein [Candidatus Peregrinibacteria bacterium]|nr:MAG: sodium:solute symporter family protein [Candidatus Peregrinibacteria bacterium]
MMAFLNSDKLAPALVILGYFLVIGLIGAYSHRFLKKTAEDYFLGGRATKTLVLLFTMAATNFSAVTIYGFSGTAYRQGYSFFPIMAFGTGFMALTFYFIGRRVWELGKEKGYMTPPQLMGDEMKSPWLRRLVFLVMLVFSLPYIAIQPIAGGYTLEALLGIPYFLGASLVTGMILLYTFWGGYRSVAWTDVAQGIIMLTVMLLTVWGIAEAEGGVVAANTAVFEKMPELFSRPGAGEVYTPALWFSYMILWFFCDPLFPQLFQRFFVAKEKKALNRTMIWYPLVTGVFFLLPMVIGVLGHLSIPGLEGKEADRIFPMLAELHFSPVTAAFIVTAGLAALMSTMDSQMLTLSSMFTKDVYEPLTGRPVKGNGVGRAFSVLLAGLGLLIAYFNPSSILQITTETFTGLAVLFPALVAILYWPRTHAGAACTSILMGELLVILYHFKLLPTGGFLSVIPILGCTTVILVLGSYLGKAKPRTLPKVPKSTWIWGMLFYRDFCFILRFLELESDSYFMGGLASMGVGYFSLKWDHRIGFLGLEFKEANQRKLTPFLRIESIFIGYSLTFGKFKNSHMDRSMGNTNCT